MPHPVRRVRMALCALLLLVGAAGQVLTVKAADVADSTPDVVATPAAVPDVAEGEAPEAAPSNNGKAPASSQTPDGEEKSDQATDEEKAPPHEVVSESPKEFPMLSGKNPVVYHARLSDVVDLGIGPFLERVLEDATDEGAAALIVEIDTPGGRVDAAVEIKNLLLRAKIPTIAWVNKQAISAGALIAFGHDYIVWSSGATMGAATPIQLGGGGEAQPVEEKMVSYMRGVMRATAEAKGRDGHVAEAMVDAGIVLAEYAPEGRLLTATEHQAEALGLLDGHADSLEEVLEFAGLEHARVVAPTINWAEKTARFLTHPVVSSALMSIGMLGILIEFYTPGFGIAGIVGALSLFFFFAGHLAVNLAGLEELLLFAIGVVLIIVEIFFIPGLGLAGVIGAIFIALSLVLALVGLDLRIAWDAGLLADAFMKFALAMVGTAVAFALSLRYLPSIGPMRRLILTETIKDDKQHQANRTNLPGQEGTAITPLRPGGKARIGGRKFDVVTSNEFIDKGEGIRVLQVDGPRITVERITGREGEQDV
jgi:membrane-bound serine protease (ClpP class)